MIKITGKLWLLALCLSLIFSTALASPEAEEAKIQVDTFYADKQNENTKTAGNGINARVIDDNIPGSPPLIFETLLTKPTLIVILFFIFTWIHIYALKEGLKQLQKIVPPKSEEPMEWNTNRPKESVLPASNAELKKLEARLFALKRDFKNLESNYKKILEILSTPRSQQKIQPENAAPQVQPSPKVTSYLPAKPEQTYGTSQKIKNLTNAFNEMMLSLSCGYVQMRKLSGTSK